MKTNQLSFLFLTLLLMTLACGRHKEEEEQAAPPSLHQDMLPEPKTELVSETDWSVELKTHLGVSKRKSGGGRRLISFYFTPQPANSDATSSGNLWLTVGSNPFGIALSSAEGVMRYDDTHAHIGGDLEPSESSYSAGAPLSSGLETIGKNQFLAVERQCKGIYVKSWYFWIANHKSLIFREASAYPYSSLWPDLRAEIEMMLASLNFTEFHPLVNFDEQMLAQDTDTGKTNELLVTADCQ